MIADKHKEPSTAEVDNVLAQLEMKGASSLPTATILRSRRQQPWVAGVSLGLIVAVLGLNVGIFSNMTALTSMQGAQGKDIQNIDKKVGKLDVKAEKQGVELTSIKDSLSENKSTVAKKIDSIEKKIATLDEANTSTQRIILQQNLGTQALSRKMAELISQNAKLKAENQVLTNKIGEVNERLEKLEHAQ